MRLQIYDPEQERSIEGTFIGFSFFEFKEGEKTWLPVIAKVGTGEVIALPRHHLITEMVKNYFNDLVEGKTIIKLEFVDLSKLDSLRQIYEYRIYLDGKEVSPKRIFTKDELLKAMQIALPEGGKTQ